MDTGEGSKSQKNKWEKVTISKSSLVMFSSYFQPWPFSRYHIDTNQLNFPKKDMEVSNYMKDGMIADWDTFEQVNLPLSADREAVQKNW